MNAGNSKVTVMTRSKIKGYLVRLKYLIYLIIVLAHAAEIELQRADRDNAARKLAVLALCIHEATKLFRSPRPTALLNYFVLPNESCASKDNPRLWYR